jgi:hypothetical protein
MTETFFQGGQMQDIMETYVTTLPQNDFEKFLIQIFGVVCSGLLHFKGQCNAQVGNYTVHCSIVNQQGPAIGGGTVAGFIELEDAKACASWINELDPRHDADVWPNPQDHIKAVLF